MGPSQRLVLKIPRGCTQGVARDDQIRRKRNHHLGMISTHAEASTFTVTDANKEETCTIVEWLRSAPQTRPHFSNLKMIGIVTVDSTGFPSTSPGMKSMVS
jgi:hypothetical protein